MQDPIDLTRLREAFLQAPESRSTAMRTMGTPLLPETGVLWLVRRRTLREEYTPIWVMAAVSILILSLRLDLLRLLTRAVGAWTPSSMLFFMGEIFLLLICLNFSVRLSRYSIQIKKLAQEAATSRAHLERLQSLVDNSARSSKSE